jgi:hypothetical protein
MLVATVSGAGAPSALSEIQKRIQLLGVCDAARLRPSVKTLPTLGQCSANLRSAVVDRENDSQFALQRRPHANTNSTQPTSAAPHSKCADRDGHAGPDHGGKGEADVESDDHLGYGQSTVGRALIEVDSLGFPE